VRSNNKTVVICVEGKEFHRGRRMNSVMGLVWMKKKIGIPLLTIGDPEEDLEKLEIAKITTWVVL
jgi:hypothetical protein